MRSLYKLVLMTVALATLVGCQTDPVGLEQDGGDLAAKTNTMTPRAHYALLESLEYDVIRGTISPGQGGIVTGVAESWPEGNSFGLMVPPGALGNRDSVPVEFTMRVPTFDSYLAHAEFDLPLVFRLEPHGLHFQEPVTVTGTYMPWAADTPTHFWHVTPESAGGKLVDVRYEEVGAVDVQRDPSGLRVTFQVNHFSEWEAGVVKE